MEQISYEDNTTLFKYGLRSTIFQKYISFNLHILKVFDSNYFKIFIHYNYKFLDLKILALS